MAKLGWNWLRTMLLLNHKLMHQKLMYLVVIPINK